MSLSEIGVGKLFLTKKLNVSRPQASGTRVSTPEVVLREVACSQIHPHDTDFDIRERSNTFRSTWVVYTTFVDIRIGDTVALDEADADEYEVERVNAWGEHLLELLILQQAL